MNTGQTPKMGPSIFMGRVDTQDFVFSQREALSILAAAPATGKHFTANAYQNASQSRIRRLSRPDCEGIESHCCRVFVDSTGKDNYRSARRHVPLGKTIPQRRER